MNFNLTAHAKAEMIHRKISKIQLQELLSSPQQILPSQSGREVYQSKFKSESNKEYLLRAVVDVSTRPPTVVTDYRTSKLHKYWRET